MELKKTISTIFMVPTLKIPKEKLKENGFINGYEFDADRDIPYQNAVYLLFKPKDMHKFRSFLDEEYERTTNIIEDYDYGKGFVIVVYKLDKNLLKDFDLIKEGKYSKTSKKFQNEFNKTTKLMRQGVVTEEVSLQYRIFNKTQDLIDFWEDKLDIIFNQDQEVWQIYDKTREVLTNLKLEEYVQ